MKAEYRSRAWWCLGVTVNSSNFSAMPLAFLQIPAGSSKVAFPSLSGLFCVVSSCANLWFAELSLDPTAEHRSDRSRCGPQASPAQLQCTVEQTVESESKPKILLVKKKLFICSFTKQNQILSSGLLQAEVPLEKKLSTIVVVEKRRLGMLKPQKGWRIKSMKTQDIVVTLYLWNKTETAVEKQSLSRGSWDNCYAGDTLTSLIHTQFQEHQWGFTTNL